MNHWLGEFPGNYFLRSFLPLGDSGSGVARALLSDRFKVIDNLDVLLASLDTIKQLDSGVMVDHCALTDRRMYVSFIAPNIVKDSPALLERYRLPKRTPGGHEVFNGGRVPSPGDNGIMAGFVLQNSKTGHGAFSIAPRIMIRVCINGLISTKYALRNVHLGTKLEEGSINWSNETIKKNMELVMSQVTDAVNTFVSEEFLEKLVNGLVEQGNYELKHPVDAVNNVCKAYLISEDRTKNIVDYFVKGADSTAFGVSQALTFFAQEVEPDLRYEYETMAVDILPDVPKFDVEKVSKN